MQVEKDCETTGTDCFENIDYQSGNNYAAIKTWTTKYALILSDGTAAAFNCDASKTCNIIFDIDGPKKGKSRIGIDVFQIGFRNGFLSATNSTLSGTDLVKNCRKDDSSAISGCFTWIMRYDNVDYLHANDNAVCSNGTTLSDTNTSCN